MWSVSCRQLLARGRGDDVGENQRFLAGTLGTDSKVQTYQEMRKTKTTQVEILDLFIAMGLHSALSVKTHLQFILI